MESNIIILFILIMFSALFSAVETAFSSANKSRLKNYANDGNKNAAKVLDLLEDYDKLITTVLIGNNIVNIAATTLATVIFTQLYKDKGATISTIVMTILVLTFGEICPKSIAKRMSEKFACSTVNFIAAVEWLLTPLIAIFSGFKWVLYHMIKIEDDDSDITDELITMVEEAQNDGDLEEHESDLISAAIEFNDLDVRDILTPRVDIVAVDITTPLNKIEETFRFNSFSRLPIYENTVDNIVGVIHEKDFYNLYYVKKAPLKSIIQPVLYTAQHVKISTLLRQLQSSKQHLAVVLDEYGGTSGIITLEDILEELVGEIWDEHDIVKEFYTKLDEDTYLVKCDAPLDDMFERFDVEDDEDHDYITVSGWVIHEFEKIPKPKECFTYKNLEVMVEKADARKVMEIKVHILKTEEEDDED